MVAAKGKITVSASQDCHPRRTAGVQSFRVYSDYDKAKLDATGVKSSKESRVPPRSISRPMNTGTLLTAATNLKGTVKLMEKTKGKLDISDGRRKPLADVSNSQGKMSRNVVFDGSKKMISVSSVSSAMNLPSRKSSVGLGNMRGDSSQKVADSHIRRRGVKDLRAAPTDQRIQTKNPSCKLAADNGRRNRKTSLPPIRKSLPVLRKVNQADINDAKENNQSLEKTKRISGFPVKAKVSNNVVRQVSIGRSHLWRNRVSDGFIIMAPRDEINMGARASSRVSIRPMVETLIKASNTCRASRSKCKSDMTKSILTAASLSKKDEEALTTSHPGNILKEVSHHATQEIPSKGDNELTKTKPGPVGRRKSDRRRSFTSSLMNRSESLEEPGEVSKKEKLPSIDDNCNQLEVAEYVDEIYQYYWVSEAQNLTLANYMSMQTDITPQMRGILINWLTEVHYKFDLMPETLYLMVTLLDQYLSQVEIKKQEMQLIGLTTLLLASKYEDFWHPRVKDLISISAESYTRDQMLVMEKLILKKLKFRLNSPTPYVFMLRFLKAAQSDLKLEHLAFYLLELCLVEYEALKFKPSMLCASAIYVALCTLQKAPAWTPLLVKHARYEVSQIRDCAEMILRFQKAASKAQLKVTYEKYMASDLSCVAAIKPLEELPF